MRIRQMGEDPHHVYVVGSPGIDSIRRLKLLGRSELQTQLDVTFGSVNLLITFHPATLEPEESLTHFEELLAALETMPCETGLYFTAPNADTMGRSLRAQLDRWAAGRVNARVFTSLGQLRYLSLMAQVSAVVGNSSSGLYEAPSMRVPTVDIGERQKGRLAAHSVLRCAPSREAIAATLHAALSLDCSAVENPYGDGHSSERIVRLLEEFQDPRALLRKRFHLIDGAGAG
jgi:UDP-N-acetylglucosamine 2-epimerase (non-hydrolysing)/GDP/UDP-N,N'-diacetylbacillosamine 2-epimerase (hydrolysing)